MQSFNDFQKAHPIASSMVIGAILVLAVNFLGGRPRTIHPEGDRPSAIFTAQFEVRQRLRAPSTARFQRPTAESPGAGKWVVAGTVDSQNAFGATVRSSYVCELTHQQGERYQVDAVNVY